jgi:aryl-alcohol dehydrogenase-like predicted oxidoreductase
MGFGSFSSTRSQLHAMARLAVAHEIGAVGVSNFSARQMEAAHAALAEHGISLATNQVQINLLHRNIESNGVLDTARRLGVTLIAYSPLREGILTGKFHDDRSLFANVPRLRRTVMRMSDKTLDRSAPLIDGLREIAAAHRATISQVALAWVIQNYGDIVVAIPGASKPHHAEEAASAQKLSLSDEELRRLSDLSSRVTG